MKNAENTTDKTSKNNKVLTSIPRSIWASDNVNLTAINQTISFSTPNCTKDTTWLKLQWAQNEAIRVCHLMSHQDDLHQQNQATTAVEEHTFLLAIHFHLRSHFGNHPCKNLPIVERSERESDISIFKMPTRRLFVREDIYYPYLLMNKVFQSKQVFPINNYSSLIDPIPILIFWM